MAVNLSISMPNNCSKHNNDSIQANPQSIQMWDFPCFHWILTGWKVWHHLFPESWGEEKLFLWNSWFDFRFTRNSTKCSPEEYGSILNLPLKSSVLFLGNIMDKPTQRKAAYRLFTTKRVSFSAVQAPFYDPRVLNTAQSVCWISNLNAPRLHSINLIPTTDASADQLTCERKDNVDRNPQPHFDQELLLFNKD